MPQKGPTKMAGHNKNYPYYNTPKVSDFREMVEVCTKKYGDKLLYKYKQGGEVREKTYIEFKNDIDALGTALISKLQMTDEHIALICENSYEWIVIYYTMMMTNGVFVPVDRELPPEGIANVLTQSDSSILIISDTYLAKFKDTVDALPGIKTVIVIGRNTEGRESFYGLIEDGSERVRNGDCAFTSLSVDTSALASLVFTSGTTGVSKGVMLSKHNILSTALYALDSLHVDASCLSVLPYHHTFEASLGLICYYYMGREVYINESLRAVASNLKLYKPYNVLVVPLLVETMYKRIWNTAEDTGKAETLKKAIKISRALRKVGIDLRRKLFKSVLDNLGGNLCKFICGGAPIKENICEFFEDIGIHVMTGYGISECSPLVSVNRTNFFDFVSTGVPIKSCKVMIDEPNENGEGEICVKGENVMLGYYKNPEATEAAFNDGWFLTGDIGRTDSEGRVYITGRKKNLIVLKNGKNVYPEEIEGYFDGSEYISELVVYALKDENDHESAITAEIFPNLTLIKDGMTLEDIKAKINDEIAAVNGKLPNYKQIKKVRFRDTEFEKTTTKKIKRNTVGKS